MIAASLVSNTVTNGESVISGAFPSLEEAEELAEILSNGALPFSMEIKVSEPITYQGNSD